jgi:restriction endonuclease Mrr
MTTKLPSSVELSASLLKVLAQHPNGLTVREIDQAVIQDLGISSELASRIRSGNRTEIQYRMAWCRTKAKKAKLIDRTGPSSWKLSQNS